MEVRYTVTLEDFVALNLYLTRKSGAGRARYLLIWLGVPTLCAAGAVRVLELGREPLAFGLALLAAVCLFTFPLAYKVGLARNVRAFVKSLGGRGIIGERALVLSDDYLVAISETFRTEVRWENLSGVDVVGDATYVFVSGISALILPRRGCDSDAEYEAARDFALQKFAARPPHA